jgi:hypothetical protein
MSESLISLKQDEIDLIEKINKLDIKKEQAEKSLKSKKTLFKVMLISCVVGVVFAILTALNIGDKLVIERILSVHGEAIPFYKFAIFYGSLIALTEGVIPGVVEYYRKQSVKETITDCEEDIRIAERQLENVKKAIAEYSFSEENELEDDFDIKVSEKDDFDLKISQQDNYDHEFRYPPKSLKKKI